MREQMQRIAGVVFVALLGVGWIHLTRVPADAASAPRAAPQVNFRAPEFELPALTGETVSSESWRGKPVLVNFWATWCPPCRAEMKDIQAVWEQNQTRFRIVGVNVAEDRETVAQYIRENKLTFSILLDTETSVARKFQVQGLPTSFFIDRDGIVRHVYLGQMNRAFIEAQLSALAEAR